jgi:hypothetical protein
MERKVILQLRDIAFTWQVDFTLVNGAVSTTEVP